MSPRWNIRVFIKGAVPFVLMVVVPLLINGAVWQMLVVPQQRQRDRWQQAQVATQLKPQLEATLADSHHAIQDWHRTDFAAADPSAVMQMIQRLAGRDRVQITALNAGAEHTSGGSTMPLDLEVTGHFNQLAHWITDVESQAGLQIDSWTLAPGQQSGQHRLAVEITAMLRET